MGSCHGASLSVLAPHPSTIVCALPGRGVPVAPGGQGLAPCHPSYIPQASHKKRCIRTNAASFGAAARFAIIPAVPELIGKDVLYRKWEARPQGAPAKGVFLLVHGLGAQSARWTFLAEYLAGAGWDSYGIELRGYGLTPERPRGHVDSLGVW